MTNEQQFTPEDMLALSDKVGFVTVLSGMGVVPAVQLPMDNDFLDQPLEILDVSPRAWNALMRFGISSIRKLVEQIRSPSGLNNIRNLGEKSIAEVKLHLTEAAYFQLTDNERRTFWKYFLDHSKRPRTTLYAKQ